MSPDDIDHSYASPNHGPRSPGSIVDHLVLHYTGMRSEDAARDWLCDPRSQVSSHYLVYDDGRVLQLVGENQRAWHAGRSFWRGVTDVNSRSIGIEICNPGHEFGYRLFPDRQIEAVIGLCRTIFARHHIPAHNVVAHSDVAPRRKEDPGEFFPWEWLAAFGIGLYAPPATLDHDLPLEPGARGAEVVAVKSRLRHIGFDIAADDDYDDDTLSVVRAFQRHWRPARVDGFADTSTCETLHRVAALFPDWDA
jgi:N-acetylmuramoyl-L-alanine amidase